MAIQPYFIHLAILMSTFQDQYDHDLNSKVVSFDDKTREIPSHLNIGHLTLFLPPGHLDSPSQSLGMSWFYFQLIQPTTHPPTHISRKSAWESPEGEPRRAQPFSLML